MTDITAGPLVSNEDPVGHPPEYPWLYPIVLALLAAGYIMAGVFLFDTTFDFVGQKWSVGILIWIVGAVHMSTRIKVADINEIVGVYFLGWPLFQASGRPILAPLGIFTMTRSSLETVEVEFPDEPQNVWHGDETKDGPMPADKVPPIRIAFSDPQTTLPFPGMTSAGIRADDPLNRRTTNEVSFMARWRVLNEFDFRRNIGSVQRAHDQMDDIGVSFLNEYLTKMTPAVALLNVDVINKEFQKLLKEKTAHWGIEIIDGRIKLINLSHNLNSSVQGIAISDAKKQATIITAEGEQIRLTKEGEGRAAAEKAEIKARGEGQKQMATDLGLTGKDVLAAETARAVGAGASTKIILGTGGIEQLVGIGATIAETFRGTPPAPPTNPPTTP